MGLTLTQAASGGPVTVAQVKAHCGIESSEWDSLLEGFISAATAHAEMYLRKAIGSQQWVLSLDSFGDAIELPLGPVTEVASVSYLDSDRQLQTLEPVSYILDLVSSPQRLVRDPDASWPDTARIPNAVSIAFTTGFSDVPPQVVQAILMACATWFRNRDAGEFPAAALSLLWPLRKMVI